MQIAQFSTLISLAPWRFYDTLKKIALSYLYFSTLLPKEEYYVGDQVHILPKSQRTYDRHIVGTNH